MKIGPYELREKLGSGTVADTFMVRGPAGEAMVAKKLKDHLVGNTSIADRFLDAFHLTGKIKIKRFLARVQMQKKQEEGVFLIREHVAGKSLAQLQQAGQLASLNLKRLAEELCNAVRALHKEGIVHGGIHPGNIVVQDDGHIRLMDHGTGLACLTQQVERDYPLGAARYLAPEQWSSQAPSKATDLYAVGLVVALVLKQKDLIGGTSHVDIKSQVHAGMKLDCPVLSRALQRDPAKRFGDVEQLRTALKSVVDPGAAPPPPLDPPPVAPEPPPRGTQPTTTATEQLAAGGSLALMKDIRGGIDLRTLNHGQPWRLPRTGGKEQWPILFKNDGPGDLRLRVRTLGAGVHLGPVECLRIKPGQSRYVVMTLDPQGNDFVRLDVDWDGQRPSQRVQIRVYRPRS